MASQYTASITFFEKAQKDLRLINSQCNYKNDCFEREGIAFVEKNYCPKFESYNFVSESECLKAGQGVIDFITGKQTLALPINNPTQDTHNNQMYELEKEKLETQKRESTRRYLSEQQRQTAECQRQVELNRQREEDWTASKKWTHVKEGFRVKLKRRREYGKVKSEEKISFRVQEGLHQKA